MIQVKYELTGTTVIQVYDTEFTQGNAAEQFIWFARGDTVKLAGYHVNSPVFEH